MALRNTSERWGAIAKTFHWLIAVLVLCMIVLGLWAVNAPLGPLKLQLFAIHKLTGLCIFVLMLLRLSWRLINPTPVLPAAMPGWERAAAHINAWALYGLLLLMPVSGYVITSAANFPVSVFGLFQIPLIVPHDKGLQELGETVHVLSFYLLAVLLSLHIAAAVRHHFILKDDILKRMLPGG
ncbi:MAG TPA: cytochrome b [Alphaproteobacteria bacterium]|nr:cytochrome b [Alphaproteobacteria bacterium]